MAEQFMIERVVINGTTIKGWVRSQINPGITRTLNAGGSELDPSHVTTTDVSPMFTGATVDLAALITVAFTGKIIPHEPIVTAENEATIWLKHVAEAADGGGHGGAGENTKAVIEYGCLVVRSISNIEGLLVAEVEIYADYDGTNAPVTFTADENLPVGAAGSPNLWVLRAIKDGTTVLDQLNNVVIDLGVTVQRFRAANSLYGTQTVVTGFAPRVTWQTADLATALAASGMSGAVAAAGGLTVYAGQYATDGPGVNAAGAYGFVFRAGSPWFTPGIALGGPAPAMLEYTCMGKWGDAINLSEPPLTVSSGLTLPAETFTAQFGPGPIKDNTTQIAYSGGRMDFGMDWRMIGGRNIPGPTRALLRRREPSITLQAQDIDYVAGLGIAGRNVNTSFTAYFRKFNAQGMGITTGSVHVSVSCSAGRIEPANLGGDHATLLEPGVLITPTAGLSVSVAAAIS